MMTVTRFGALVLMFLAMFPTVTEAAVYGEKKKGTKGRYLETSRGVDLGDYRGALVILEPAEIESDKDQPVDTESVRATSDDTLQAQLKAAGIFGRIVSVAPLELPENQPIVRVTTKLTLQHGSQAMRFWVGAGAGKSKLHIRIDFVDARSGESIGYFNGYGTGAGFASLSGGGVQRMARDDLEESYTQLAEYLRQAAGRQTTLAASPSALN